MRNVLNHSQEGNIYLYTGHWKYDSNMAMVDDYMKMGLPVGFLLLQYSVLFTVEALSLLYLLFIS